MKPEDVPAELVETAATVLEDDAHEHCNADESCPGNTWDYHLSLARAILAAVLPAHEATVRARIADELQRDFLLPDDDPFDEANNAVRDVIRHLRGQCTICGRAPDGEPCGYAHAANIHTRGKNR